MSLIVFGVVLPWLVVGLGCWLGYQLVRQNGRILLRLEALEERLAQLGTAPKAAPPPLPGLPIGSMAPAFDLPDLNGNHMALEQLQGQHVLLIFFNPDCGFCRQMAPALAALPVDGQNGHPVPLVVTTGDVEANRQLVKEQGIRCPVVLQEGMAVATRYQVTGTPMGYLIDEQGVIASELAVGAQALLVLATAEAMPGASANGQNGHAAAANGSGHREYKGNRSLADSRINRNGLRAGTPAPAFRLPTLDGGELSLEAYRGRRVLLVFSDPDCGPCNQLAPELERLHRRWPDIQVIMISRGDPEANRVKVSQHRLTFPVALQRQWEISREYGMFATPMGYLIDEEGRIAADVAVGMDAILALVSATAARPPRKEEVPMP